MKTLLIQYQIGNNPPSWYPLWTAPTLSQNEIDSSLQRARSQPGSAFANILQWTVSDDVQTEEEYIDQENCSERAEYMRCGGWPE